LRVILCVGETLTEREAGRTQQVVEEQLQAVVELLKPADWRFVVTVIGGDGSLIVHVVKSSSLTSLFGQLAQAKLPQPRRPRKCTLTRESISLLLCLQEWEKTLVSFMEEALLLLTAESWVRSHSALTILLGLTGVCVATQPDVDGFLVGGASLKPEFVDIVNARK
jgi:triosephosphate isomerase